MAATRKMRKSGLGATARATPASPVVTEMIARTTKTATPSVARKHMARTTPASLAAMATAARTTRISL